MKTHSKKEELTRNHCAELAILRKLVSRSVRYLEKSGEQFDPAFWGEKENFLSILTKLTGLQTKLIPLEQELLEKLEDHDRQDPNANPELTLEEWTLLEQALTAHRSKL